MCIRDIFNVDGFIGRQNSQVFSGETIDLADEEQREALAYLLTLSEDAAPYYLTKLDAADLAYHPSDLHWNQTQTVAVRKVYHMGQEGDFRSWNLGRAQACILYTSPLPLEASRGDQILNANYFESKGFSMVLQQADMTDDALLSGLLTLWEKAPDLRQAMENSGISNGTDNVISVIYSVLEK